LLFAVDKIQHDEVHTAYFSVLKNSWQPCAVLVAWSPQLKSHWCVHGRGVETLNFD